ncbi:nitroreductase family deazaflavin-dependent oxidoreductase [Phenylobacterium sp.]|uniref:nitroreductase family deazaflavin-dependent oxidoreductase n=1 Tax=Phenylobacterium sp. TaxID=1871053 RepID=UPI002F3E406C
MSEEKPRTALPGTDISLVGEKHLRLYLETNGEQGYLWNGVPILVLTTKGRKSGEQRQIPIIFSRDGDNYFIIASKGGAPTHPAWYLNLVADPQVQVQVKGERLEAVARTAASPERERLWAIALKDWPSYDVYQSRTTRQIPVVVLERNRR